MSGLGAGQVICRTVHRANQSSCDTAKPIATAKATPIGQATNARRAADIHAAASVIEPQARPMAATLTHDRTSSRGSLMAIGVSTATRAISSSKVDSEKRRLAGVLCAGAASDFCRRRSHQRRAAVAARDDRALQSERHEWFVRRDEKQRRQHGQKHGRAGTNAAATRRPTGRAVPRR